MKQTINNAQQIIASKFMELGMRDILRGLLMTVLGAVVATVYGATTREGGFTNLDWEQIALVGFNSGLNYLILNYFTSNKVMIVDAPKQLVKEVKEAKKEEKPVTLIVKDESPGATSTQHNY